MPRPTVFVVAGPNGSGKTSLTRSGRFGDARVIDPDAIAHDHGLGEMDAGREALRQRRESLDEGRDFVVETTLSGGSPMRLMDDAKVRGFNVELHFISVRNADEALARIGARVESGGHDVPEADVRRRFERAHANLPEAITMVDSAKLYDNTDLDEGVPHRFAAELTPERYWLSDLAPEWAREAAREAAALEVARATTIAERERAEARVAEVAVPAESLRASGSEDPRQAQYRNDRDGGRER